MKLIFNVIILLVPIFTFAETRLDIKQLNNWAPDSELNCVATSLYASEEINDFMHVDPDDFAAYILPYCYKKTQYKQNFSGLIIGFGTSEDKVDYHRLQHVFFVESNGTAVNKAGSSKSDKVQVGVKSDFVDMSSYFSTMESALDQSVTGEVEFYIRANNDLCPLNNYEKNLRKYISEDVFFETRDLIKSKVKNKITDLSLTDAVSMERLLRAYYRIEGDINILYRDIIIGYKEQAIASNLKLDTAEAFYKIRYLVKDPVLLEKISEYFYLRIARKQVLMAMGRKEMEPLPELK